MYSILNGIQTYYCTYTQDDEHHLICSIIFYFLSCQFHGIKPENMGLYAIIRITLEENGYNKHVLKPLSISAMQDFPCFYLCCAVWNRSVWIWSSFPVCGSSYHLLFRRSAPLPLGDALDERISKVFVLYGKYGVIIEHKTDLKLKNSHRPIIKHTFNRSKKQTTLNN